MGESKKDALRVKFDKKLKLEFHGVKVTSDAGLLAFRELDEALGLTAMIESDFCDNRKGRNTQHNIIALLRQSIYSRLAGYEDNNDAERLSVDPAMRQIVGERAKERAAASTSQRSSFLLRFHRSRRRTESRPKWLPWEKGFRPTHSNLIECLPGVSLKLPR